MFVPCSPFEIGIPTQLQPHHELHKTQLQHRCLTLIMSAVGTSGGSDHPKTTDDPVHTQRRKTLRGWPSGTELDAQLPEHKKKIADRAVHIAMDSTYSTSSVQTDHSIVHVSSSTADGTGHSQACLCNKQHRRNVTCWETQVLRSTSHDGWYDPDRR